MSVDRTALLNAVNCRDCFRTISRVARQWLQVLLHYVSLYISLGICVSGLCHSSIFQNHRQTWSTSYNSFDVGKWYFVEMSWNLTDGLLLYVNSHQVDYQQSAASWPPETGVSTNLYVGLNGDGNTAVQLAVTVDELNFYNADINTLKKIHFIQSGIRWYSCEW